MSDTYYVTILGEGSYTVPPAKVWRGPGTFPITPEQAETILAEKEAGHVGDYVIVSTTKPDLDVHGKPDWMLRPEDLAWNRAPAPDDEPDRVSPDTDYEPQDDEFLCDHCSAVFTSEGGLAQHTALKHFAVHEQVEDDVREQLAAERERKALVERIRQADPKELRPEERPLTEDAPESPLPDHLWPPALRERP